MKKLRLDHEREKEEQEDRIMHETLEREDRMLREKLEHEKVRLEMEE